MRPQSLQFKKLVHILRGDGYTVKTRFCPPWSDKKLPGYWFANVTGKSIRGGFCEPSGGESYWYLDGRVAFDHEGCFDKWSKCPYSLELPNIGQEFMHVLERMAYLRTKEGFDRSNCFDLRERDYPFSTHVLCPTCDGMKKVPGKRIKIIRFKNDPPMRSLERIICVRCKGKGKIKREKK